VRICRDDEEDDARETAEREPSRRRYVAVPRGERARSEGGEKLGERGGNQPGEGIRRDGGRLLRQPSGDELAPEAGEGDRDDRRRDRKGEESDHVGAELLAEAAFGLRARQIRHDHHAERLCAEDEHEVYAVGGEETVRLEIAAELVREKRAGDRAGEAQRDI
jgi:hypothetical protein